MGYEITKRVENLEFALVLDMERVMLVGNEGIAEPTWRLPLDTMPFFGDNETSEADSSPFGWDSVDGGVVDEGEAVEECESCRFASRDGKCTAGICLCVPF